MKSLDELLKSVGEKADQKATVQTVAGLQFYAYDRPDELRESTRLRPQPYERLQLVRSPENPYDSNAFEIWFKNGQFQLGHLPRHIAELVAPKFDEGSNLRAYALTGGNGRSWSVEVLLVGDAVPDVESEDEAIIF